MARVAFLGLAALSLIAAAQDNKSRVSRLNIVESARKIDRLLADKWRSNGLERAEPADDAEFLRRAKIDILGHAPDWEETEEFLADPDKEKRSKKIDEYVFSDRFATFWGETLTNWTYGYVNADRSDRPGLLAWFVEQVERNMPYDAIARKLVSAKGTHKEDPAVNFIIRWLENDKPEELTKRISKVFLGVKLNCASCHDHPFAKWKREHFYQFAGFFMKTKWKQVGEDQDKDKYWEVNDEIKGAKSFAYRPEGFKKPMMPLFLNGLGPSSDYLREELAKLMTADVQFARASINRFWAHFLGKGIVEPVDDFQEKNPAISPDLLNLIASHFAEHRYDIRTLARLIAHTAAYQLSSRRPPMEEKKESKQERFFTFQPLRLMQPGQIFDTIVSTTRLDRVGRHRDKPELLARLRHEFVRFIYQSYEDEFIAPGEFALSTQQIMRLMTWSELYLGLHEKDGIVDRILSKVQGRDERIRAVFLAILGRTPSEPELERVRKTIADERAGAPAYAQLAYALMQMNEFYFNH
jgi:hypothetical protein